MEKQTAVEWFIEQIKEYDFTPPFNNEEYVIVMPKWIFDAKRDEAKAMHKHEHDKTSEVWFNEGTNVHNGRKYQNFEQYYNEIYGGNNEQQ